MTNIIWDYDDQRWVGGCTCAHCGARLHDGHSPCPECSTVPPVPNASVYDDGEIPPGPTRAQVDFFRSLVARKASTLTAVGLAESGLWSRSGLSDAITALKGLADLPAAPRTNQYRSPCSQCDRQVEAGTGYLTGGPGAWVTTHRAPCPPAVTAPVEAAPVEDPPEGVHTLDGKVWKVQEARTTGGRRYLKTLTDGGWVYLGRRAPFFDLSPETLISIDEAAEYGHLYGVCVVCGRDLTDEHSIERGIGPVCYARLLDR